MKNKNINEHLLKGIIELGIEALQQEGYSFHRGKKNINQCKHTPGKYLLSLEYLDVCAGHEFIGDIDLEKITMAIHNARDETKEAIFNYDWDAYTAKIIILSAIESIKEEQKE